MHQNTRKEIFQIAGDQPDPAGTGQRGTTAGYNLGKNVLARPVVLYKDRILTIDLYSAPGAPLYAVVYCPICAHRAMEDGRETPALRITQDNKKIDFDADRIPRFPGITTEELVAQLGLSSVDDIRGGISIEQFRCTWEEEPSSRRQFGLSVCKWSVVIDNNIARDV